MNKMKLAVSALGLALLGSNALAALPEFKLADAAARARNQALPVVLPGKPQADPEIITGLGPDGLKHFLKLAAFAWKRPGGTLAVVYRRSRERSPVIMEGNYSFPRNGAYLQPQGQRRPDGSLALEKILLGIKIGPWSPYGGMTEVFSIDPQGKIDDKVLMADSEVPDSAWKPDQIDFESGRSDLDLARAQDGLAQAIQVMMRTHIIAGRAVSRPFMGFIP